jgi:hypothetical protein
MLNAGGGPIRVSSFGSTPGKGQYATFTDGKTSWTIYDTSPTYNDVTKVAQTLYESSRSGSGGGNYSGSSSSGGSQARDIAEQVIRKNPEVQSVLYVGNEIYLYRDTLKGQSSQTVARADTGINAHIKNAYVSLSSVAYASTASGSGAGFTASFASTKAVGIKNPSSSGYLSSFTDFLDPSGNTGVWLHKSDGLFRAIIVRSRVSSTCTYHHGYAHVSLPCRKRFHLRNPPWTPYDDIHGCGSPEIHVGQAKRFGPYNRIHVHEPS